MAHDGWNCCFSFRAIFCPFTTQTAQNMIISKKWKQMPGDIIILHMSTINQDHMLYGSWDVKCKGKSFMSFCTFLLFDPSNNPKNQNSEKIKTTSGDIIILHLCTTNDNHIMYGSWDIKHDKQDFCHFGLFFALLPPWKSNFWKNELLRKWTTQKKWNTLKIKLLKKWRKNPGDIIILHMSTINKNHMMYDS